MTTLFPRDLADLAREVLSRPRGIARCPLCGCEVLDGAADGTGAHRVCTADVMREIDADAVTLDPHPSTGFGDGFDADDLAEWIESCERDFGQVDMPF